VGISIEQGAVETLLDKLDALAGSHGTAGQVALAAVLGDESAAVARGSAWGANQN